MDPYIGEIRIFAGNFAPNGWALCNGQLMPIASNTPLFSILGTTYGGDGKTTFALPNLMGRAPLHAGAGPGLTPRTLGEMDGEASVTLLTTQMPAHTHAVSCASAANQDAPTNAVWAGTGRGGGNVYATSADGAMLSPQTVTPVGESMPHNNMQPYLGMNYIIALQGVFPPRP